MRDKRLRNALRILVPLVPFDDARQIVERAGRAKLAALAPQDAIYLATVSHIRHHHTEYDALLEAGYERETAREIVAADIDAVLSDWGGGASLIEGAEAPDDPEG